MRAAGRPEANGAGATRFLLLSSVRAGGGHWSAARAISEALLQLSGESVAVDLVDVHSAPYLRYPASLVPGAYEPMTRTWADLWSLAFWLSNGRRRVGLGRWLSQSLLSPGAFEGLAATRPSGVISTVHMIHQHRFLRRALRRRGADVPFVQIITDPVTVHRSWISDEIDLYIVATQVAERTLVERFRVPAERIRRIGAVTGLRFAPADDKRRVRTALGLNPDRFTVLIAGGAAGAGPLRELVEAVAAAHPDLQLVVVCGRNEVLRQDLAARLDPSWSRVCGYVDNLHELMQASDVLLTKAGPGTIAEALACGLPVFITGCTRGTESGNPEFYESLGVARFMPEPQSCVEALRRIASGDRADLHRLEQGIQRGAPWNRAPAVAMEIRRFCLQASQAAPGLVRHDYARSSAGLA